MTAASIDNSGDGFDSLERLAAFISSKQVHAANPILEVPDAIHSAHDDADDPLRAQLRIVRAGQDRLAEARRAEEALLADALFWVARGDSEKGTFEDLRARADAIGAMLGDESEDQTVAKSNDAIDAPNLTPFRQPEAFDAEGHRRRIGDLLVDAGVITQEELDDALAEQKRKPHKHIGTLLVEHGYASSHMIARIIASQLRLPYVDLEEEPVDREVAKRIDASLSFVHGCIPIRATSSELVLAMEDPLDLVAQHAIEEACGLRVVPVVAAMDDIREAQQSAYDVI